MTGKTRQSHTPIAGGRVVAKEPGGATSCLPNLTVELTVKPLKTGDKVSTSEHNKNNTERLKCLDKGVEGGKARTRDVEKKGDLYHRDGGLFHL